LFAGFNLVPLWFLSAPMFWCVSIRFIKFVIGVDGVVAFGLVDLYRVAIEFRVGE
jgi:hypothetical protein